MSECESPSIVSNSLQTHGQYSPWNSPGQNWVSRVGSCSLLQGILPTQGSNPGLLHSLPAEPQGNPIGWVFGLKSQYGSQERQAGPWSSLSILLCQYSNLSLRILLPSGTKSHSQQRKWGERQIRSLLAQRLGLSQAFITGPARLVEEEKKGCWLGCFRIQKSCLTLCNPMDCSLPGSSVHGDSPDKKTEVSCHALLQGIFPTQGSNLGFPHCRRIVYHLSHQGSPWILEWVAYPFFRGSSWPRNWTGVSCIASRFFTSWASRARVALVTTEDVLKMGDCIHSCWTFNLLKTLRLEKHNLVHILQF